MLEKVYLTLDQHVVAARLRVVHDETERGRHLLGWIVRASGRRRRDRARAYFFGQSFAMVILYVYLRCSTPSESTKESAHVYVPR